MLAAHTYAIQYLVPNKSKRHDHFDLFIEISNYKILHVQSETTGKTPKSKTTINSLPQENHKVFSFSFNRFFHKSIPVCVHICERIHIYMYSYFYIVQLYLHLQHVPAGICMYIILSQVQKNFLYEHWDTFMQTTMVLST